MKKFYTLIVLLLSILLVACNNQTKALEAFYEKVDRATNNEKDIIVASEQLEQLENDKLQLFNKVNKAKSNELNKLADELIKNTADRKRIAQKESKIMNASKKKYENAKKDAKAIEDKNQKQQVEKLVSMMDEKYVEHDALMKSYQNILTQELDLFKYLKSNEINKSIVNEKIAKITKLYEAFQKKTDQYTKITQEIEQLKKPIVKKLNES